MSVALRCLRCSCILMAVGRVDVARVEVHVASDRFATAPTSVEVLQRFLRPPGTTFGVAMRRQHESRQTGARSVKNQKARRPETSVPALLNIDNVSLTSLARTIITLFFVWLHPRPSVGL